MRKFLLIALLASVVLAACNAAADRRQQLQAATAITTVLVDALNERLVFDTLPKRLVTLSPSQTEMVFTLGAQGLLVGRSETSTRPAQGVGTIPAIGTYPELNVQLVASLKPDLVLVSTEDFGNADLLKTHFRSLGIPVMAQRFRSLDDLYHNALQMGQLTNRRPEAERFVTQMESFVDSLRARMDAVRRVRAAVVMKISPLTVACGHSFLHEVMELAGAKNAFGPLQAYYAQVPADSLLSLAPEFLFVPAENVAQLSDLVSTYPQLARLPAVQLGQVYQFDAMRYQFSGPFSVDAILALAAAMHPETSPSELFEKVFLSPAQGPNQAP